MYKAIFFDLGGVLFTKGTKIFIDSISKRYSLPNNKVKEIIDGKIASLYTEAKISRNQFWNYVIKTLSLKESPDKLEKEWIDSYTLINGTKSIIDKLKSNSKYNLYYLSDSIKERVEVLDKKFDFTSLFSGGVFSYEVGVRKPNPLIYKYALKKAQCKAQETVFIDDKQTALESALKMGIVTILFKSPQQLKNEFIRLSIY